MPAASDGSSRTVSSPLRVSMFGGSATTSVREPAAVSWPPVPTTSGAL
jgi:hypothetical protein